MTVEFSLRGSMLCLSPKVASWILYSPLLTTFMKDWFLDLIFDAWEGKDSSWFL